MTQKRILIVDDERRQRNNMKAILGASYHTLEAGDLDQAKALIQKGQPDLILLDVMLEDIDSVAALEGSEFRFQAPTVLVTGRRGEAYRRQIETKANTGDIRDFLYKPYGEDELLAIVEKHLGERPQPENVRDELKKNYNEKHGDDATSAIVCACNAMVDAKRRIEAFAQSDVMVLIRGETGTGKELVAREIHRLSPRSSKPFVAVNCAAIPETLLESELFGVAPYAGIDNAPPKGRPGRFEQANGGTIFLDEIGDMPLLTQAKVLRVLQDGEVTRLSGTAPIKVQVRIVTATNQDLEQAVKQKRFRADLYYRIKVAEIHLPALKQRGDDVELLIEHFLHENERVGISEAALKLLLDYNWPGNVRELEHAIASAVALTPIYGDLITEDHLDAHIRKFRQIDLTATDEMWEDIAAALNRLDMGILTKDDVDVYTRYFRGLLLDGVLKANDGNQAEAARQLGAGEKFYSQKTGVYQQWRREKVTPIRKGGKNECR